LKREDVSKAGEARPDVSFHIGVRVRYADADRLGIAYHSRYLEWFESARTELLRELGLPYKELEERGFHLPVVEAYIRYLKPAFYDDLLSVKVSLQRVHRARIDLIYEVSRDGEVLAIGRTVHAFVDSNGRATRPPKDLLESLNTRYTRKVGDAG